MENPTGPYNKGDQVPQAGDYVCVPCGFKKHYQSGEQFGECLSCFSGTPSGKHDEYVEGMEMWEPMTPAAPGTP